MVVMMAVADTWQRVKVNERGVRVVYQKSVSWDFTSLAPRYPLATRVSLPIVCPY